MQRQVGQPNRSLELVTRAKFPLGLEETSRVVSSPLAVVLTAMPSMISRLPQMYTLWTFMETFRRQVVVQLRMSPRLTHIGPYLLAVGLIR